MKQFELIYKNSLVEAQKEANDEMKGLQEAGADIISVEAGVHPISYICEGDQQIKHEIHFSFMIVYNVWPTITAPVIPLTEDEKLKTTKRKGG